MGDRTVFCGECGSLMVQRSSRFGPFWGCSTFPTCRGTHGAHPDGTPLGTPANAETKVARIRAHDAFDTLWQTKKERRDAYHWMRKAMGMSKDQAHIGRFNIEQCSRLVELVEGKAAASG